MVKLVAGVNILTQKRQLTDSSTSRETPISLIYFELRILEYQKLTCNVKNTRRLPLQTALMKNLTFPK